MIDFKHTQLSLKRPLGDYFKIQILYSELIRNRKFQLRTLPQKKYVNLGCGKNIYDKFINIDYLWRPSIDLCWDITKGIPLPDDFAEGVFTEHCLEHISFEACKEILSSVFRVLKPGGIFRIIVPDAELYLILYQRHRNGEKVVFPYYSKENLHRTYTPMMAVNRVFREHGHLFAYDFETISCVLNEAGFKEIYRTYFGSGKNSEIIVDSYEREKESLYVEAVKPS